MSELPHTISGLADSEDARSPGDDIMMSLSLKRPLLSDERRLINSRLVISVTIAQEKLFEALRHCEG
jgi:hypothetical protein